MNFAQDTQQENTTITAYTDNYLVINETRVDGHCLLHHSGIIRAWQPADIDNFCEDDFASLVELRPEVLILGTGNQLRFPANAIRRFFISQGIGLEVMDTGAACRTYNILLNEGRDVAAAILLNIDR